MRAAINEGVSPSPKSLLLFAIAQAGILKEKVDCKQFIENVACVAGIKMRRGGPNAKSWEFET